MFSRKIHWRQCLAPSLLPTKCREMHIRTHWSSLWELPWAAKVWGRAMALSILQERILSTYLDKYLVEKAKAKAAACRQSLESKQLGHLAAVLAQPLTQMFSRKIHWRQCLAPSSLPTTCREMRSRTHWSSFWELPGAAKVWGRAMALSILRERIPSTYLDKYLVEKAKAKAAACRQSLESKQLGHLAAVLAQPLTQMFSRKIHWRQCLAPSSLPT